MIGLEQDLVDEIVERIVARIRPRKIVLFGSHARGSAEQNSDIDLLVVAESEQPRHRRSVPLYGALSDMLVPMDIIVYTPEEIEDWRQVPQAFVTTALREGKVLYEDDALPSWSVPEAPAWAKDGGKPEQNGD